MAHKPSELSQLLTKQLSAPFTAAEHIHGRTLAPPVRWCISEDRPCDKDMCLRHQVCHDAITGQAHPGHLITNKTKADYINGVLEKKANDFDGADFFVQYLKAVAKFFV